MEPIATAIITEIASGIASNANTAIQNAYAALKTKLFTTFSGKSEALDARQNLEKKPDSTARQAALNEELIDAKLEQNDAIKLLLNTLFKKLSQAESGQYALKKYTIYTEKIRVIGENVNIKKSGILMPNTIS
jgi:hypothetical protein